MTEQESIIALSNPVSCRGSQRGKVVTATPPNFLEFQVVSKKFQETQVLSSYFRPWCDWYASGFFWIFFTQEGRISHRSRKYYFSYFRLGYKSGPVVHNIHLIFIDSIMLNYLKLALQWILFLVLDPTIQTRWIMSTRHTLNPFLTGLEAEKSLCPLCCLSLDYVLCVALFVDLFGWPALHRHITVRKFNHKPPAHATVMLEITVVLQFASVFCSTEQNHKSQIYQWQRFGFVSLNFNHFTVNYST